MDRNAEMKWYMDQFSGSRERFYEIHMQMCRKVGISWSKATSKERQFIEEITRFTFEREQAQKAGLPLDTVKPMITVANRNGRRSAAAFFCILQKNRIAALFYK